MTLRQFLLNGNGERVKGCVHGAALGLCCVMTAYNLAAWISRREKHLALNTVLYTAGLCFEWRKVKHHFRSDR